MLTHFIIFNTVTVLCFEQRCLANLRIKVVFVCLCVAFPFFLYLTLLRTNLFKEIYCPALEAPFRGSITPSSCTDERANIRRTTVCTYGCETGHYVTAGDNSLTCQIDGLWQGTVPYCQRKYNSCLVTKGKL